MRKSLLICIVLLVSISCRKSNENPTYTNRVDYQIYSTKPLAPFSGSYTYYYKGKSYVQAISNSIGAVQADFSAPSGQKIELSAQITQLPAGASAVVQIYVNQQLVATNDSTNTATFTLN